MKLHLLFLCVCLFFACTDPQLIGLEVQPTSDRITISTLDESSPFSLQTIGVDSVRSDEPLAALLGYYESDLFRNAKASFSTQLLLSQNSVDFGNNPILDSAVLSLSYSGYYGDTTNEMMIHIEQLGQAIFYDSTYYSNQEILSVPFNTPIIHSFEPRPNTLVFATNDTIGQKVLSFRVDAIGQMILEASSGQLADSDAFLDFFNGITLSVDDNSTSSSILYFNLKDGGSKLTIYYNDSLSYDLLIGSGATRINHFDMQQDQTFLESLNGIQSMAGYELELTFNNLTSLKQSLENKVVNQALLRFSTNNNSDIRPAHSSLSLVRKDSTGKKFFIEDIAEGQTHYGGYLEGNEYVFNISKYILNLLNEEFTSTTLVLVPSGEAINANQTEIKQEVELNIIYTEF
ncbi:MAG: DUF4270 family protein [Bacteroidota bacterium]|nr:DUF4270 family protein [Bacteroidota bacterium]